jgi:O-antigen/teichoic acid export membrane protein
VNTEVALGSGARAGRLARPPSAGLKSTASGASLVLGGAMVWQVSNFLFNAAGAHVLGPARFGVLAASLALLSFTTPLLAAVQATASREATSLTARGELPKAVPMLRHYGLRVTCGALVLGGIAAATSHWVSGLFHLGSPWLVVIAGAAIPCYAVSHLLGGLLQGVERFGRFALESAVEGSAKAILGIVAMGLVWRSALSGMAAVFASCVLGLVTYLLVTMPLLEWGARALGAGHGMTAAAGRARDALRPDRAGGRQGVARYSMTALVTYGFLALMLSSDTLVAKHYLSSHQAGLYAGVSLAGKIAFFAASSLFVVAFPLFSRHHDHGGGNRRWILAAGGLVCTATGMIVGLFALEPAWVVIPLLGGRYQAVEGYVPWMAAVFGLYALGYLACIYLLAGKRRGVVALLAAAVAVQFTGFFVFHSTTARLMSVLAVSFGVLLAGGILLIVLGGDLNAGAPAQPPSGLPGGWRGRIVTEVTRRAGSVPVLLGGSRALGTAHADSDYDVAVVLPLWRIPRATARLAEAAGCLTAQLKAPVSVNPVPALRMRWPGGSLYARKLRAEGKVLAAPPGWRLRRQPVTSVTKFGGSSALLSAAQSLLQAFGTPAMAGHPAFPHAGQALRKAALLIAQVRLLRAGRYAADLETALARLHTLPAAGGGGVPEAQLAAALTAALTAPCPVTGFRRLRECLLAELAEISDTPLASPMVKSVVRNAQYAVLAWLRGRSRWRAALRRMPVEAALAAAQLALLRALDPGSPAVVDAVQLQQAIGVLPKPLAAASLHRWEDVRDLVLAEWPDAHPLVGLLA